MERQIFYQGQVVGVTEMERLQTVPQALFDNIVKEIIGKGVVSGLVVSHNAGYGVTVSAGAAYDTNGRRAALANNLNVNCAVDYLGAATVPIPQNGGVDQERYLTIFAKWQETLSDLITLPDESSAYYTAKDTLLIQVVAGSIAALGAGVRPALRDDSMVLADIKLTSSSALANTIHTDRRQSVRTLVGLSVAPTVHTHVVGDITGLQSTLDGLVASIATKVGPSHTHVMGDVAGLATALAGKAPTAHSHAQGDITGLTATLAALPTTYAGLNHTHSIAQVTGLQGALDGKSATNHTHTLASLGAAATAHSHSATDVLYSDSGSGYTYKLSIVAGALRQTRVS